MLLKNLNHLDSDLDTLFIDSHQIVHENPLSDERSRKGKLRGMKFHVYETDLSQSSTLLIWSFIAVADATLEKEQVKSFLEKQVYITQPLRQDNAQWRTGPVLAAQADFAPILLQKMNQVSTDGKLAMVNQQVNTTKEIMQENINVALEKQEAIEALDEKAQNLSLAARQFRKKAKQVKRFQMVQNAKHGVLLGTAVTAGIAVVVVPPLVAIL